MLQPVFRIRIHIGIRIQSGQWIRIRIWIRNPDPDPGGQKSPTKNGKNLDIEFFEVLNILFEG
jgi:hypothetical protein